ncbi:hypothetical protein ACIBI7_35870 [Nonomuraea fuscirosea]|uniref:hypothetical protein n=1 Tax=Nonomuraea fuscirosea TaxID=1291556 RepID=UPI0037B0664E
MEEIVRDLAKILVPSASKEEGESQKDYEARTKHASDERKRLVKALMAAASLSSSEDPVLARLDELATKKADIQRQMTLILAYAREFVRPEPYRLKALAKSARMSISGVRTAYASEEVVYIANVIQRRNNDRTIFPNQGNSPKPADREPELPDGQWWAVRPKAPETGLR